MNPTQQISLKDSNKCFDCKPFRSQNPLFFMIIIKSRNPDQYSIINHFLNTKKGMQVL